MSNLTLLLIVVPVIFMLGLLLAAPGLARRFRRRQEVSAVDLFRMQREQLEAKFFDLARGRGIPRDLRWVECDWLPEVTWGRAIEDGMLTAFVGVNIRFEAIEGGDMEDVEAVGLVRDAAAIFHFQDGRWGTGGRAMFNMDPVDAIDRLSGQYEPVTTG
ncbi:MAG TPA: hypothetical protein DCE43_24140 [Planctomycetaceae bacterium]|nr:hypothetical protein [Planctomycetaceae bacterium]HAA52827.1 hypothetical protein [Planctomycetaceae bacterium]HCK53682.1 hypothetical protein [Planctomycetaceae bacterium]